MAHELHDIEAAQIRPKNYNKAWFGRAASLIEEAQLRDLEVLELGSGNGEFAEIMRDRYGMRVTCADYIDSYVDQSRASGFEAYKVDLEAADLSHNALLPGFRGRYDLVVMLEAIDHIFDTDQLLVLVHTLLKPGGFVLITTPNIAYLGYRVYSLVNGNVPYAEGHHIRFFDERLLRQYLYYAGFDSVHPMTANGGRSSPLDRICTRRSHIPERAITMLWKVWWRRPFRWLVPKSQRSSGLGILCRREDLEPLGLSWQRCKQVIDTATQEMRELLVNHLKQADRLGFMDEHPRLRAYVHSIDAH